MNSDGGRWQWAAAGVPLVIRPLRTRLLVVLLLVGIAGCAPKVLRVPVYHPSRPAKGLPEAARIPPTQKPYRVRGHTYYPLPSSHGYRKVGRASWYGRDFHGRTTSNGERYNMYDLTAAHKTLPMGTHLLVRNLDNNRQVVVRVNDRGPFVKGRVIDLSYGAAQKLDMVKTGVAKVELIALGEAVTVLRGGERVERFLPYQEPDRGEFYIQIGSFANQRNAGLLQRKLVSWGRKTVVRRYQQGARTLYRVQVRGGRSLAAAERMEKYLEEQGFPGAFVVAR